ncbi:DUF2059 domain-containing protein [Arenimonas sp.]|uniref:DUF2059 domain-containing protein n=1 Tax=Arenimonas sp. TaxID=1872635 RepID=UPI0035B35533
MNHRHRFAALALSTLLALPGLALAADKAKVAEYLDVMQVEQNFAQMEGMLSQMADQAFEQALQQNPLEGESLERARAAHAVSKQGMLEAMSWTAIKPEITALFEKELTNAEVDAAVAYYRSPEGASLLAKQPALMQATMQIGQRRAQEIMPRMQAQMQEIFKKEAAAQSGD